MKFAIFTSMGSSGDTALAVWKHVDATGWDAACVTDHFMPNTRERVGDTLECWTSLAALAAHTQRMRVGTIVAGNTYRHPAVLAKMATNVDISTGGRLMCGIGGGWQQNEHEAYGIPFYTVRERLERLEEACQMLKLLWTQDKTTWKGRHYELADAPLSPKPVQKPYPELLIGGGGEKVTMKIAARHADHWNTWGGPATLKRKCEILDAHCATVGRDPKQILRSAVMPMVVTDDKAEVEKVRANYMRRMGADEAKARDTVLGGSPAEIVDTLGRLKEAGVGLLFIPNALLLGDWRAQLDRFMADVAPRVQ